jgi:hypothetical protein
MGSSLGLVILTVGFVILLWTFLWFARLLTQRARPRAEVAKQAIGQVRAEIEPVMEEGPELIRGRGYGANYGLFLGLLACALFFLTQTPLLVAVVCVGLFYSGRSLVRGLRYFRVVVWRALAGVLLNIAPVFMLYLYDTGQWPFWVLDAGLGVW